MIVELLFNFFLSVISFFFCFYLPGNIISKKLHLNLENLEFHVFSSGLGMVFFVLLAFVFDLLKIFYLVIPLFILINIYSLKNLDFKKIKVDFKINKNVLLLLTLSIVFTLPMITRFDNGSSIRLIIDAPWHFSLINELVANFPPNHPNMAGVAMNPYHFFADYLIAKVMQIFPIGLPFSYFQYFSFLTSFLWVFGTFILVKRWTKNNLISIASVMLSLFGGSFAFVLLFFGESSLSLNSAFGILQPDLSLINPPFAMSLVILIFGLFSVLYYLQTRDKKMLFLLPLFFGIAAMFKVYSGMILFFILFLFAITRSIKKDFSFIIPVFLTSLIFYITYWSFVGKSGFLMFAPLWAPHDVVRSNFPGLIYQHRFEKYMKDFEFTKLFIFETFIFAIYFIGNLGTRLLGLALVPFSKHRKVLFSEFGILIILATLFSFFVPLLFMQSIKPYEIVQMFNYFLFFVAIISSIGFMRLLQLKSKKLVYFIIIIITLLTIPTLVDDYYRIIFKQFDVISGSRYYSYKYLRGIGDYSFVVMEIPAKAMISTTSAIFNNFTNGMDIDLPALANKSTFLTNSPIGFPEKELKKRLDIIYQFSTYVYATPSASLSNKIENYVISTIRKNNIKYIYTSDNAQNLDKVQNLKRIYNHGTVKIYEVI
ncbi:MAG: hypothetical protein HY344_02010 [Candidatus Levybacteria bacterium]|nr:hypothetical protein [Candidatus Levybacteria bacterium]